MNANEVIDNAKRTGLLTKKERDILHHLGKAWELFLTLDDHHPSDLPEAMSAVHIFQLAVAFRVARRVEPEVWWSHMSHATSEEPPA